MAAVPDLLDLIAEREAAATEAAGQLRAQIAALTEQLALTETELADLATTRTTLTTLTGQTGPHNDQETSHQETSHQESRTGSLGRSSPNGLGTSSTST